MISLPFTVITLKNVPKSLRGDLTKWMQEIATGVYVGNFNTKVREKLWNRVVENVDGGEATMSFAYRNEIGYNYCTINAEREVVDLDGIPLILLPNKESTLDSKSKYGYSNASKFRKAKKYSDSSAKTNIEFDVVDSKYVMLAININKDLITIGIQKILNGKDIKMFIDILNIGDKIGNIKITENNRVESIDVKELMNRFKEFIGCMHIVTYDNMKEFERVGVLLDKNGYSLRDYRIYDLLKFVKKDMRGLDDYSIINILKKYDIIIEDQNDTGFFLDGIYKLSTKVNKFTRFMEKE